MASRPRAFLVLAASLALLTGSARADENSDSLAAVQDEIEMLDRAIGIAQRDKSTAGAIKLLEDQRSALEAQRRQLNGEPEPKPAAVPPSPSPQPAKTPAAAGAEKTPPPGQSEAALALALAAADRGQGWGGADPFIQRALKGNPQNPAANTAAAMAANAKGDFASAKQFANTALKADPGNSQALKARAMANNGLGDRPAGLKDAKTALQVDPLDKAAKSLVNLLENKELPKEGRVKDPGFEQAADPEGPAGGAAPRSPADDWKPGPGVLLAPAAAAAPGKAASLVQEAAAKLRLGDAAGAARAADAALASGAADSSPLVLRGRARDAMGHPEEAVQDETAALEKEMDASLAALMERAWSQAGSGHLEEARADALAAKKLAPQGSPTAELAERIAARPEAVGTPDGPSAPGLPVVPDLYSGISPRSLEVARAARERLGVGDLREALRLSARAVSLDRGNHLAFIVSAAANRLLGRYGAAVGDATEALRLQPRAADALLARSLAYLHLKAWSQAEADASAAIAFDPGRIEAFRQRSLARRMLDDAAGSAQDDRRAEALASAGQPLSPRPRRGHAGAVAATVGAVLLGAAAWRLKRLR